VVEQRAWLGSKLQSRGRCRKMRGREGEKDTGRLPLAVVRDGCRYAASCVDTAAPRTTQYYNTTGGCASSPQRCASEPSVLVARLTVRERPAQREHAAATLPVARVPY
jgi:hypothetical protein